MATQPDGRATCTALSDKNWVYFTHFTMYFKTKFTENLRNKNANVNENVTIQYNTIQYNTIQYNTVQYNRAQYNTVQYSTVQYNTIQYNTI